VAIGSILFAVENVVQTPFPWIRLGLANIVTLLALQWWGLKEALLILVLRVLLGSFLTGKFLHPAFVLSLSGGIVATLAMHVALVYKKRIFSLVGVSIVGALAKNIAQLLVAYFLYVKQSMIITLLPLFLFSTLVTGIAVGILAHLLNQRIAPK